MMTLKNALLLLLWPWIVLSVPLAATAFEVEGWAWGTGSFVIAWLLLAGVGFAYRLLAARSVNRCYRRAAALALATALVLVWINGAVGIIGSEDNPANALYAVVLAVGVFGAAAGRLKPLGMAWALAGAALAQLLVPLVALSVWPTDFNPGVAEVIGLNFVFVALFAVSALLFRRAGREPSLLEGR